MTPERWQQVERLYHAALGATKRLQPLLHSSFNEWLGAVSPDGQWLAYESNESGSRTEIFLRPLGGIGGRREQVSIEGGRYPTWSVAVVLNWLDELRDRMSSDGR